MEEEMLKSSTIIKDKMIEPYFIGKDATCYTVYELVKVSSDETKAKRGRKRVVTEEKKFYILKILSLLNQD